MQRAFENERARLRKQIRKRGTRRDFNGAEERKLRVHIRNRVGDGIGVGKVHLVAHLNCHHLEVEIEAPLQWKSLWWTGRWRAGCGRGRCDNSAHAWAAQGELIRGMDVAERA